MGHAQNLGAARGAGGFADWRGGEASAERAPTFSASLPRAVPAEAVPSGVQQLQEAV